MTSIIANNRIIYRKALTLEYLHKESFQLMIMRCRQPASSDRVELKQDSINLLHYPYIISIPKFHVPSPDKIDSLTIRDSEQ